MSNERPWILHPFLLATYVVAALLAFNIDLAAAVEAIRPLIIILAATAAAMLFWQWLVGDWQRAGLIVSLHLLLFFGYGHVINWMDEGPAALTAVSLPDRHRFLTALLAASVILLTWALWRLIRRPLPGLTLFLNITLLVAMVAPLWQISLSLINRVSASPQTAATDIDTRSLDTAVHPDIYYIIMDAYTRDDVLREIFSHDNRPFSSALTERGFEVIANSHSNYSQTSLSLASSMNFRYLDEMPAQMGLDSEDRQPLGELIRQSRLRQILETHGYQTVSIASGYNQTEFQDADIYLRASGDRFSEFEIILLQTTWPGSYFGTQLNFEAKRQQVEFTFETLREIAPAVDGPKFVFAHLIAPHVPNVFGPNGERVLPNDYPIDEVLANGDAPMNLYLKAYTDELTYLNTQLLAVVDAILAQSEQQPIIIIQGDHGSRAFLDSGSAERTCMRERLSIYNAILAPPEIKQQLYANMTPINSYPLILNHLFDADIPLQPDQSYFSSWQRPYDYIPISESELTATCPASR